MDWAIRLERDADVDALAIEKVRLAHKQQLECLLLLRVYDEQGIPAKERGRERAIAAV